MANYKLLQYHIAPNYRGTTFPWIGLREHFVEYVLQVMKPARMYARTWQITRLESKFWRPRTVRVKILVLYGIHGRQDVNFRWQRKYRYMGMASWFSCTTAVPVNPFVWNYR